MPDLTTTRRALFKLDDRPTEWILNKFRDYCHAIPFATDKTLINWAGVLFDSPAGWAVLRDRLRCLLNHPESKDERLPETKTFVLAMQELLETSQKLFDLLQTKHQGSYYLDLLGLANRADVLDGLENQPPVDWAALRDRLRCLLNHPESKDERLPEIKTFVLAVQELLKMQQVCLNRLQDQYQDLYYLALLKLTNWAGVLFGSANQQPADWAALRSCLTHLLVYPESEDERPLETQTFVLTMQKLLETSQELFYLLRTKHQDSYYLDLLGLTNWADVLLGSVNQPSVGWAALLDRLRCLLNHSESKDERLPEIKTFVLAVQELLKAQEMSLSQLQNQYQDQRFYYLVLLTLTNWAGVLFDSPAGWAVLRDRLTRLLAHPPEPGDDSLPETQTFVLAMLKLLETPRELLNQLPAQHQDLYYRKLLGLTERPARPDRVALGFTLDDTCTELKLPAGMRFDAGQDSQGTALHYQLDQMLVANHAQWTDLRWCRPLNPNQSGSARIARVVFDVLAGQEWPEGGVRLFEPSPVRPKGDPNQADQDKEVVTGRIIGSLVLAAAGGARKWTVEFASNVEDLEAWISIGGQWIGLPASVNKVENQKIWDLELGQDEGAPTAAVDLDGLTSDTPLLRLTRKKGQPVPNVSKITLNVTGAIGVRMVTDDGVVAINQSCYPFGGTPRIGSGVNLVAADWWGLASKLTEVTVTPVWLDLPIIVWETWYAGYSDAIKLILEDERTRQTPRSIVPEVPTGAFQAVPLIVKADGKREPLNSISLFQDMSAVGTRQHSTIHISIPPTTLPVSSTIPPDSDNLADWPWYLRLELSQSFLHEEYAKYLAIPPKFVLEEVKDSTGKVLTYPDEETPIKQMVLESHPTVNPPYTPYWNSLLVNYTAKEEDVKEQYILTPFGYAAPQKSGSSDPQAEVEPSELYLGVKDVQPGQLLSLHWQLRSPQPQKEVNWEYLAHGEQWKPADKYISDGTEGLHKSGAWLMTWPVDALDEACSSMPAGRYWLRALIKTPAKTSQSDVQMPIFPRLMGMHTNAGWATLTQVDAIDATHFAQPLPAGSVAYALEPLDGLQAVDQLWPSEGGRAAESSVEFARRVAKRLRHRERALNGWDLVTLLKDRYPGMREIRMADAVCAISKQERPIEQLVVMPVLDAMDNTDVRRPALSAAHLNGMRDWLKERASPWLQLECRNPEYVPIPVELEVKFKPGISNAYGQRQLWRALEQRYLPWVWGHTDEQVIGKALNYYEIQAFIQGCEEVETIELFKLDGQTHSCSATSSQVLLLVQCGPEYANLGIAFEVQSKLKSKLKSKSKSSQAAIYGNGLNQVSVTVQYPSSIKIGSEKVDVSSNNSLLFFYNCDTAEKLYNGNADSIGSQLGYTQERDNSCPAPEYSGVRTAPSDGNSTTYYIYAGEAAVGTNRIGVGLEITTALNEKIELRSHEAGKYLTVIVHQKIEALSNSDKDKS